MIDSIKDLEKILKLLRKQGVFEFEHNGTKLKLGDLPREYVAAVEPDYSQADDHLAGFPEGMLTPEQLIFYSAGGSPEDDPENKQ